MAISKITTTPTPLSVVDKINEVIDGKLDTTAKAASATTADSATTLSGLTATVAELNYVDGVTSNVQTQLNGKLSTSGTAAKATADASGNNIANTYATKAQAVTNLTASGKTVTFTKADGSTGTFTTQDTTYSLPTASASTLGGIKVGSGLSISNGVLSSSGGSAAVSAYKIPYATCSTATSTAAKVATITNGVSFSLVAGSCCYVKFDKAITPKNSKLSWTLNINSTGARYFREFSRIYEAYFIWETRSDATAISYNDISTGKTSSMTSTIIPLNSNTLFIYDGSYYVGSSYATAATYGDYGDA